MSTESEEGRRIVAALAIRTDHVADVHSVAEVIITMLQDTSASLVPIVGPKAVAALYRRSLRRCITLHASLAPIYTSLADPLDLIELKTILIQQMHSDVIFFGEELLKALYELVTTLIGPSLSARLLLDVWEINSSAPRAQEISQ